MNNIIIKNFWVAKLHLNFLISNSFVIFFIFYPVSFLYFFTVHFNHHYLSRLVGITTSIIASPL